jgi:hypothetical protein
MDHRDEKARPGESQQILIQKYISIIQLIVIIPYATRILPGEVLFDCKARNIVLCDYGV